MLAPEEIFGSNYVWDGGNKKLTIDVNDLSSAGDLPPNLGLSSGLLDFGTNLSEKNARKILWAILILHFYNQSNDAEIDPEFPMSVVPSQGEIVDRSGVLSRRNTLEVSFFQELSNQSGIISASSIQ